MGASNPARMRSRVDLPLPEGPSTHTNSRGWMENESLSSASETSVGVEEGDAQFVDSEDGIGHGIRGEGNPVEVIRE